MWKQWASFSHPAPAGAEAESGKMKNVLILQNKVLLQAAFFPELSASATPKVLA